jgi:DNA replication licensing factor MCM3
MEAVADGEREEFIANKRIFGEFLDSDGNHGSYSEKVRTMMEENSFRLIVDLADLRAFQASLARQVLKKPLQFLPAFEDALKDLVLSIDPSYGKMSQVSMGHCL